MGRRCDTWGVVQVETMRVKKGERESDDADAVLVSEEGREA